MQAAILVTGGAGFIGANLVSHLLETTNWDIIILDRLDSTVTLNRLVHIPHWEEQRHRVRFVWWDLKAEINQFTRSQLLNTQYIIHLAASSHVDRSIKDPASFVQDNVTGTLNILNLARELPHLSKFYYQSTDEVMGPAQQGQAFSEEDPTNPCNPYAASKAGGEALATAWACTYQLPIIIGRCMNVYGIYQHPEKFIPLVIRKLQKQETILIHADSEEVHSGSRCYISAENLSKAIHFLLAADISTINRAARLQGIYNIAGEIELTNLTLAQQIAGIMNTTLDYRLVGVAENRPGHDLRYALSGKKMETLGWKLEGSFPTNLERIVKWYLSHPDWLHSI